MALKAITQVASPSFQRGKLKKLEEQRPALRMSAQWATSSDAEQSHSIAAEARERAAQAKAAGGLSATKTLHDKAVGIFTSSGALVGDALPLHLRSAFSGAGVIAGAGTSTGNLVSPRCSSPRCNSPRYLQHTMASALRTRAGGDAPPSDASLMPPAGGDSNNALKHTMDLANDPGEQPRRLRRTLSTPRARAAECFSDSAVSGSTSSGPGCALVDGGATEARADAGTYGAVRPHAMIAHDMARMPSSPQLSSHDKSIPNARRSQRASGQFVPGPVLTSVEALANSKPQVLTTDAGFASTAITRRARGQASPMPLRPTADPNPASQSGLATVQPTLDGAGVASGVSIRDNLLMGRRGRGMCSPAGMRSSCPYQWD